MRNFACPGLRHSLLSRRQALSIGGGSLLGLSTARLLGAEASLAAARAKSVVFLYQFGGPSHVDMFDMKPDAPDAVRGPHRPAPSVVPGLPISERLPRVAQVMDKVCLLRGMHHEMKNHNSASYYALTGREPPSDDIRLRDSIELFPAYGSVVDALTPADPEMPGFVAYPHVIRDGSVTPGQHASFLGKAHDPLLITEDPADEQFQLPELSLPAGLHPDRLARRRSLQQLVDGQLRMLEYSSLASGLDAYYERALAMLSSDRVKKAFDLSRESESLRDAYGRHTYGQSLVLARRLVEAGVRFVNVYFSSSIGGQSTTSGGWDTHGFNNTKMYPIIEERHLPITDQTLPTFLNDLDDRGLLDETLVVWMGEFGRTPRINQNASRDHWPQCYTALLAGGGVRRGFVYGASDRYGERPDRDGCRPDDLAATMFYLLGLDPHAEVSDAVGRPLPISSGRVLHEIIA